MPHQFCTHCEHITELERRVLALENTTPPQQVQADDDLREALEWADNSPTANHFTKQLAAEVRRLGAPHWCEYEERIKRLQAEVDAAWTALGERESYPSGTTLVEAVSTAARGWDKLVMEARANAGKIYKQLENARAEHTARLRDAGEQLIAARKERDEALENMNAAVTDSKTAGVAQRQAEARLEDMRGACNVAMEERGQARVQLEQVRRERDDFKRQREENHKPAQHWCKQAGDAAMALDSTRDHLHQLERRSAEDVDRLVAARTAGVMAMQDELGREIGAFAADAGIGNKDWRETIKRLRWFFHHWRNKAMGSERATRSEIWRYVRDNWAAVNLGRVAQEKLDEIAKETA